MKKRRLPNLPRWLGGIYLGWSLLVFFGRLGSESHSWWPLFLYCIIWPLSTVHKAVSSACLNWLIPDPNSASEWIFTLDDYIAGVFYIVAGTIWVWFLGRVVSSVATRLFPLKNGAGTN
ncbi:MAG: hypothetical protein HY300_10420 [Verrucomicrobia bacterium]|nr:hypothetical protein [Verrucomicrobiota bacterium]